MLEATPLDEMVDGASGFRPHWRWLLGGLAALGHEALAERAAELDRIFADAEDGALAIGGGAALVPKAIMPPRTQARTSRVMAIPISVRNVVPTVSGRAEDPLENRVDLLEVMVEIEIVFELFVAERLFHIRIGLEQAEEIVALAAPHLHRIALD